MSSDLTGIISKSLGGMSKGQKKIASFILEQPEQAAYMTASKLGATVGVSESTVVRFAIELGFAGYPELHRAMQESLQKRLTSVQRVRVANDRIPDESLLESVLERDAEQIRSTLETIDKEAFASAVACRKRACSVRRHSVGNSAFQYPSVDYHCVCGKVALIIEEV